MTPEEKNRLYALRKAGRSYTEIADEMGISKNTVKTYCRRTGLTPTAEVAPSAQALENRAGKICPYCGKPVVQILGRKEKKFCSDICRNRWWNNHMDLVARKAMYEYTPLQSAGKNTTPWRDCSRSPWKRPRRMPATCPTVPIL